MSGANEGPERKNGPNDTVNLAGVAVVDAQQNE